LVIEWKMILWLRFGVQCAVNSRLIAHQQ